MRMHTSSLASYDPPGAGCPVKSSTGSRLWGRESGLSDILARGLSLSSLIGDAEGFEKTFELCGASGGKIHHVVLPSLIRMVREKD